MSVSRSNVLAFASGVAAGAAALATYPRWKHKVAPLVSAVVSGAAAAAQDVKSATTSAREVHAGHAAENGAWASSRNARGAELPPRACDGGHSARQRLGLVLELSRDLRSRDRSTTPRTGDYRAS